jgi:hypothetical protein
MNIIKLLCAAVSYDDLSGVKKIPVVPVSYREKIRVGGLEIYFFLNFFFMVFSIISVTTDAILAAAPTTQIK